MRTILVVEDDPDMAAGLRDNLSFEGYDVIVVHDGPAALRAVAEETPHLVLLDVMIPKLDGFEVCRRMREGGLTAPIIMLTARGQEIDKVRGLELGADDYVTKPFGVRELLARIKAALRRADGVVMPGTELRVGAAVVDFAHARVRRGEQEFPLGH
ncbi:MAG: response regulator transcription factor, partial [Planctomycetes bacterium]|nr:response regulator transcription factor [Planctomycetota bacterium]